MCKVDVCQTLSFKSSSVTASETKESSWFTQNHFLSHFCSSAVFRFVVFVQSFSLFVISDLNCLNLIKWIVTALSTDNNCILVIQWLSSTLNPFPPVSCCVSLCLGLELESGFGMRSTNEWELLNKAHPGSHSSQKPFYYSSALEQARESQTDSADSQSSLMDTKKTAAMHLIYSQLPGLLFTPE